MTLQIRSRLTDVAARFSKIEVALFTSFNFHAEFFERNVLPALFGDSGDSSLAAREQLVHRRLRDTRVGVVCDPSVIQPGAGRYRYTVYPKFVPGRVFHPKTIILFGHDADGARWIYLAVMSANLTISGWGRNCEGFADIWLHSVSEQPVQELKHMLQWLRPSRAGRHDALSDGLGFIEQLQQRRSRNDPEGHGWLAKDDACFYFSPRWSSMWAFVHAHYGAVDAARIASPYWGGGTRIANALGDAAVQLTASLSPPDMLGTGLGRDAAQELMRPNSTLTTWNDEAGRFFHVKLYELHIGNDTVTGIGSCNCTEAGLFWEGAEGVPSGNAEAMLFRKAALEWHPTRPLALKDLDATCKETHDDPLTFCVTVEYDWKGKTLSWCLEGETGSPGWTLHLPDDQKSASLDERRGSRVAARLPTRRFFVHDPQGARRFEGVITEVELDNSSLTYGSPLSIEQILESWQAGAEVEPGPGADDDDDQEGDGASGPDRAIVVPFEAFTFFQALRRIQTRIAQSGEGVRDWLVSRSDSVCAFAEAFVHSGQRPSAVWIVLNECLALLEPHWRDDPQVRSARKSILRHHERARLSTLAQLAGELRARGHDPRALDPSQPEALLKWFEHRFKRSVP